MKVACVRDPLRLLKVELSMLTIPKVQVVDMHQLRNLFNGLKGFGYFRQVFYFKTHWLLLYSPDYY